VATRPRAKENSTTLYKWADAQSIAVPTAQCVGGYRYFGSARRFGAMQRFGRYRSNSGHAADAVDLSKLTHTRLSLCQQISDQTRMWTRFLSRSQSPTFSVVAKQKKSAGVRGSHRDVYFGPSSISQISLNPKQFWRP